MESQKIKFACLAAAVVLVGCGSKPAPQPIVQQNMQPMPQQTQPMNAAPPVVAQQPYPATPNGSPAPGVQPPQAAETEHQPPAGAAQAQLTIPSGTPIAVRLDQALDTRRNRSGDRFTATLANPIQEDGQVVLPKGTRFSGHVTASGPSGRMKGQAILGMTLDSFEIHGASYPVTTTRTGRASTKHKKRNLVLIGGGSGLGALIGGIAGGGKGALIGGGAGAAAGTAGAAITGKKNVSIPAETLLTFRLEEDIEL